MSIVYDFDAQLKNSHQYSDSDIWESIYRSAFPTMLSFTDMRHNGIHQKRGIDRIVTLMNGKHITVDEKVRGKNKKTGKVYEDIALEFISVVQTNAPGWVCNPDIDCDYIAYAINPLGKGYLFPVVQVQAVWDKKSQIWLAKYGHKISTSSRFGRTWNTKFCPVPPAEVMQAIGQELRFQFEPNSLVEE